MSKNESPVSAAKQDFLKMLLIPLVPLIYQGICSIYTRAVNEQKSKNTYFYIKQFQIYLKEVPSWNNIIIKDETDRIRHILKEKHNYYLRSMITLLIVLQIRIFSAIRIEGPKEEVNIDAPKEEEFIHNIYIHVAKTVYESKKLLTMISKCNDFATKSEFYEVIRQCIEDVLFEYIPVSTIINSCFGNMFNESNKNKYSYKNGKYINLGSAEESDSDSDSEAGLDENKIIKKDSEIKDTLADHQFGAWPKNEEIGGNFEVGAENELQEKGYISGLNSIGLENIANSKENLFGSELDKEPSLELDQIHEQDFEQDHSKSIQEETNMLMEKLEEPAFDIEIDDHISEFKSGPDEVESNNKSLFSNFFESNSPEESSNKEFDTEADTGDSENIVSQTIDISGANSNLDDFF